MLVMEEEEEVGVRGTEPEEDVLLEDDLAHGESHYLGEIEELQHGVQGEGDDEENEVEEVEVDRHQHDEEKEEGEVEEGDKLHHEEEVVEVEADKQQPGDSHEDGVDGVKVVYVDDVEEDDGPGGRDGDDDQEHWP